MYVCDLCEMELGKRLQQQPFPCSQHKSDRFLPQIFVQIMLRIDLIICGFRANMCTTERENTKNGGTHHEKEFF